MSNILKNDLASLAIDHCIFPIIDAADIRRDGPAVIESGSGITIIDVCVDYRSNTDLAKQLHDDVLE